ncbi:MAG TPA: HAD hydrolase-like protein [Clostridia bacterium]|nr:HAD hydrolase-like protein [Clostridia bacterium]
MRYDTVFFDLDGTLIKSGPAIFATTRATLDEMGLACPDDEHMHKLIGPPLKMGFGEILKIPEDRIDEAIARYRENAKTMGIALAAPYEGILPMLKSLKEHGLRVGIVTSKVHSTALEQLAAFQIAQYLGFVRGAFSDGNGEKTALLQIAVKEFCTLENRPVMVGDRYFDLNAARNVGIDSIGVLYGYGERVEIENCNPTHIVKSVPELERLLIS